MKNIIALFLFLLLGAAGFADDETDFATTPPVSWTRFNPLSIASFTFSGGVARLSSPAPPLATFQVFGPARLALFAPTTYTQTVVSADLVAWGPTKNVPGVMARATNLVLGGARGYTFGVIPSTGEVAIHRVTGEVPALISSISTIAVTPGHSYRIMLICVGSNITGRIFDLADLTNPMITVTAVDSTYPSGVTGIVNTADSLVGLDVSFDNFLAWDGSPPPLTITPGAGTLTISANAARSLSTNLETTTDLTIPFVPVFPTTSLNGALLENTLPIDVAQRFYRRKLVGAP